MKNRNLNHKDDWATPDYVYRALDKEFNFNFDPCPLHSNFDGLSIEWKDRNYINPPYSLKLKIAFVKKAIEESKKGKLCVMLLPVSTSTKLFHDFIFPNATEIRLVNGRIKFEGINSFGDKVGQGSKGAPMHDSMIVIFKSPQFKTQGATPSFNNGLEVTNATHSPPKLAVANFSKPNIKLNSVPNLLDGEKLKKKVENGNRRYNKRRKRLF